MASRPRIQLNLRTRIYFTMLALILISFVLTGVTAFYNFKTQNEEYNKERFRRKEEDVKESMGYFLQQKGGYIDPDSVTSVFSDKICELADVHNMDINLFDVRGENLMISSTSTLENTSEQIDYPVRKALTSGISRAEAEVEIDTQPSILAYWYFLDNDGRRIAITNVVYDKTEVNREELSSFLLQLTQIYVILFIGAAILAYFLSNYITKSLQRIGTRMQMIRVGEQNEPLEWSSDDEIGALVKEYNRMLEEVESSAILLAQSERESAWREMAKQVAHEIKNPLTPMKLRIQHLQRAWADKAPGFEEKLDVTTQTLIEQIDTLSHIADEFSSFAKMPKARQQELDLALVLKNAADLFEDSRNTTVAFRNDARGEVRVVADKNQLQRVFTNLIKNAVQAIPDSRRGEVLLILEKSGDQCRVRVVDNGKGIPPEDYNSIFVPNFTTKSTGTGLGLAMVKNIVNNSGGNIWFESTLDEGTTFFVTLPAAV